MSEDLFICKNVIFKEGTRYSRTKPIDLTLPGMLTFPLACALNQSNHKMAGVIPGAAPWQLQIRETLRWQLPPLKSIVPP